MDSGVIYLWTIIQCPLLVYMMYYLKIRFFNTILIYSDYINSMVDYRNDYIIFCKLLVKFNMLYKLFLSLIVLLNQEKMIQLSRVLKLTIYF